MKFPIISIRLFIALMLSFTTIFSQNSNSFSSGGGFKIDLPQTVTSAEKIAINDPTLKMSAEGKSYVWENPQAYRYEVSYYKLTPDKNALTAADKKRVLDAFKEGLLTEPKKQKLFYLEKEYTFNGNKGAEVQTLYPSAKSVARVFIVGQRLFFINMAFNRNQNEAEISRILDSFALLDAKALIAAKIEEATPKALPQEPVIAKLKSDAQDNNLKGKVKIVVEENQDSSSKTRERDKEQFYNESGNLTKEISYSDGYPDNVTIYGYIDGKRVKNSNYISFDDDQRLNPNRISITVSAENSIKNPNLPRDTRYSVSTTYKYNEKGQLIEEATYQNNGELWRRTVFNYKDNEREELDYGDDNAQWSRTVEILDKSGDVIERNLMDAKGKVGDKILSTYEYDAQGNWIVKKDVEKVMVKGKPVLKPLWTSYRTITYHQ